MKFGIAPRAIAPLIIGATALAAAALISIFPEPAEAQARGRTPVPQAMLTTAMGDSAAQA